MQTYARSNEGRELVVFTVSDEATMGKLDAFTSSRAWRELLDA